MFDYLKLSPWVTFLSLAIASMSIGCNDAQIEDSEQRVLSAENVGGDLTKADGQRKVAIFRYL